MTLTIVIPAADRDTENAWMKANIDPEGGEYTFSQMFNDGADKYIATGEFTAAEQAVLAVHFASVYEGEVTFSSGDIIVGETTVANDTFIPPDSVLLENADKLLEETGTPVYMGGWQVEKDHADFDDLVVGVDSVSGDTVAFNVRSL